MVFQVLSRLQTFALTWLNSLKLIRFYCFRTVKHNKSKNIFNSSDIYCSGPILEQVQKAKLYNDDKYFVDMKLREAPGKLLLILI